jgi:prepilin-type N-terminal cleavage/methylation domain-containing protein
MQHRSRIQRARRGFSLIELVVSMAVLGLITFFLTDLLVRQSRTYTVVDDVTETQQNLRAITSLLERELRATGFLVPEGAAICGYDTGGSGTPDDAPDVVYVTDAEALDPAGVTSLTTQAADLTGGTFDGDGVDTLQVSSLVVDANPFYDLDGDGVAESDFLYTTNPARNGGVIVVDRNNPGAGAACGVITDIDVGTSTLTVDFDVATAPNAPAGGAAPDGTPLGAGATDLVVVPAHVYWINPGAAGGPPQLIRDGMVLANDVEDLQLALFYDVDDDGVVDGLDPDFTPPPTHSATEYPGSAADNAEYEPGSWDNSELREVRVTVVARTRAEDPNVLADPDLATSVPQGFENRAPGAVPDGFRRRSITLTVQPRNVDRVL